MIVSLRNILSVPRILNLETAVKTKFAFAHTIEIVLSNYFSLDSNSKIEKFCSHVSCLLDYARKAFKKINIRCVGEPNVILQELVGEIFMA